MSSKKSPFRVLGQRSLPSSFSSCYKKPVKVVEEDPDKGSHVSISDFSERKLHQNSGVPTTIKVRSRPFSTLLGPTDLSESIDEKIEAKKGGEAEKNPVALTLALAQFKHTDLGKGPSIGSCSAGEVESSNDYVVYESRKRRNPFQGGDDKHIATKHFAVLGGNPKHKHKKRRDEISKEKPGTVYNHYANGCGWWDCNMEGVDNEEVGLNEVWEGVGSTTLGGIEWH